MWGEGEKWDGFMVKLCMVGKKEWFGWGGKVKSRFWDRDIE